MELSNKELYQKISSLKLEFQEISWNFKRLENFSMKRNQI